MKSALMRFVLIILAGIFSIGLESCASEKVELYRVEFPNGEPASYAPLVFFERKEDESFHIMSPEKKELIPADAVWRIFMTNAEGTVRLRGDLTSNVIGYVHSNIWNASWAHDYEFYRDHLPSLSIVPDEQGRMNRLILPKEIKSVTLDCNPQDKVRSEGTLSFTWRYHSRERVPVERNWHLGGSVAVPCGLRIPLPFQLAGSRGRLKDLERPSITIMHASDDGPLIETIEIPEADKLNTVSVGFD